ncbi:MAG: hypothetical protein ACYTFK_13770 [Planctomycetota bacterium]|jgi:hypothetical protein
MTTAHKIICWPEFFNRVSKRTTETKTIESALDLAVGDMLFYHNWETKQITSWEVFCQLENGQFCVKQNQLAENIMGNRWKGEHDIDFKIRRKIQNQYIEKRLKHGKDIQA